MDAYFKKYFKDLNKKINDIERDKLVKFSLLIKSLIETNRKCIFVGNGGSASIASHVTVDLIKAANIKAINFNEANFLTCYANDFGYENWIKEALKSYANEGDLLILISSSGESKNIINGAKQAKKMKVPLITFSGFKTDNQLKKMGDLNFWVNSNSYNIVEMTHHIWLVAAIDFIVEDLQNEK